MGKLPTTLVTILLSTALFAQSNQSLPAGFLNTTGTSSTAYPFNSNTDHKWQWHYDSAQFTAMGPITITEIWVRASTATATVAPFGISNFTVTVASSPTDYSLAGSGGLPGHDPIFANNLNADQTIVRSGPWNHPGAGPSGTAAATWIPFGLTSTFSYDPTVGNDFVIQLESCGVLSTWATSLDGSTGAAFAVGGNRYGDISSCSAPIFTFNNNEFVPIVRIDYLERNLFALSQTGPGLGNLTVSLTQLSSTAIGGFTIVSTLTALPVGSGPMFGLHPEYVTFNVLSYPYQPGNPFHFSTFDVGLYPNVPINYPNGTVTHLAGMTMDFVVLMYNAAGSLDSTSNLVRIPFL
jgi:hypothetical protein